MKKVLLLSLLFLPSNLWAQSLPATTEVNLKVTLADAELIWRAMRKMPVEDIEALMAKLRQQVSEQTQPKTIEIPPKVELTPQGNK